MLLKMKKNKKLESVKENLFDKNQVPGIDDLFAIKGGGGSCTIKTTWWILPDGFGEKSSSNIN